MNESVWTIIGVGVGLATLIISLFKNSEEKLSERFKFFESESKGSESRLESLINNLDTKFASESKNFESRLESSIKNLDTKVEAMFKNSDTRFENFEAKVEAMFKNSEEKNIERFKHIDIKFDFLEKKLDISTQDLKHSLNKIETKVNAIDGRVVEVERHLFALRTLMHYDVDIDKPKKLKEVN